MLCFKRSTNSIALYGELGRILLLYIRKIRMVKYWLNILSDRNSLLYKFYEMLHNGLSSGLTYSKKNRAYQVKCILDELGFSYLWFNQNCTLSHLALIKNRVFDQYRQTWISTVSDCSKLDMYSNFKDCLSYECEKYLSAISNVKLRVALTKFRISAHDLEIERGRYTNKIEYVNSATAMLRPNILFCLYAPR